MPKKASVVCIAMTSLKTIAMGGLTAGALVVFIVTLLQGGFSMRKVEASPDDILGSTATPADKLPPSLLPARLNIPSINVDADVQHVGIGTSGNMAVPSNYTDVGWYRYGTVPGYRGSAVINGHVDNGFGLDAVFRDLDHLRRGDVIIVETKDGTEYEYKVESVEEYAAADVPLERLFSRADKARLNLITCTGEWNAESKEYDRRVVVYAVLV